MDFSPVTNRMYNAAAYVQNEARSIWSNAQQEKK